VKFKRTFGPKINYPLVEKYKHPNNNFTIITGSCFCESKELVWSMAKQADEMGATHLRSGVYRAGTFPPKEMGFIDEKLLLAHRESAHFYGLKNIMDILDYSDESMDLFNKYADCFQVGARAMQSYALLKKVAGYGKPVFLKRHVGCTVDEWLGAAEYLLKYGCKELYLIERGSSTFHNDVRWTPCLHVIPSVKSICKIPVIIDASHSTGRRDLIEPITLAGVAAGAKGLLVEIHDEPDKSLSDSEQAIYPSDLQNILNKAKKIREII